MGTTPTQKEIAVFGGGCFWCTEAIFKSLKGIISVVPGYTGGTTTNPTYEQVADGNTGHVESIKIEFDPAVMSYDDLLAVFFNTHDPTSLNRQGNDIGTQYASTIFYVNDAQKATAEKLIGELEAAKAYDRPVVTALKPLGEFYPAEDYHRNYYETHKDQAYCQIVIEPKLEKLQKKFSQLLSSGSSN